MSSHSAEMQITAAAAAAATTAARCTRKFALVYCTYGRLIHDCTHVCVSTGSHANAATPSNMHTSYIIIYGTSHACAPAAIITHTHIRQSAVGGTRRDISASALRRCRNNVIVAAWPRICMRHRRTLDVCSCVRVFVLHALYYGHKKTHQTLVKLRRWTRVHK